MEQSGLLPLNLHCRNARLCLKKAAFSKKSQLWRDEVLHLRKFESLVACTIPSHPLYPHKKCEKPIAELQAYLIEAQHRIKELETQVAGSRPPSTSPSPRTSAFNKELDGSNFEACRTTAPYKHKTSLRSPLLDERLGHGKSMKKPRTLHKHGSSPESSCESWSIDGNNNRVPITCVTAHPNSPDDSFAAIVGGCSIFAAQHNCNGNNNETNENLNTRSTKRTAFPQTIGLIQRSLEWEVPARREGENADKQRQDDAMKDSFNEAERSLPDQRWPNFRFGTEFFEKKLQERISRIQNQYIQMEGGVGLESRSKSEGKLNDSLQGSESEFTFMISNEENYMDDQIQIRSQSQSQSKSPTMSRNCSMQGNTASRSSIAAAGVIAVMKMATDADSAASSSMPGEEVLVSVTGRGTIVCEGEEVAKIEDESISLLNSSEKQTQNNSSALSSLEEKFVSLQSLVYELKCSTDGCSSRIWEETEKWQSKMEELEKDLLLFKYEADSEIGLFQRNLKEEMKMMIEELRGRIENGEYKEEVNGQLQVWTERMDTLKQQVDTLQDCSHKFKSLKGEVDASFMAITEQVAVATKKVRTTMKDDMQTLEKGICQNLASMKNAIDLRLASLWEETERRREEDRKQIQVLIEEKLDKRISKYNTESDSEAKNKLFLDFKNELSLLWGEVDLLSKGRESMKTHVDQLTQIAEMARENISIEQGVLRNEIKKEFQSLRRECMEAKAGSDDLRKETEREMSNINEELRMLKEERNMDKESSLRKMTEFENSCRDEKLKVKREMEMIKELAENNQKELVALKRAIEENKREKRLSQTEMSRDKMAIIEKVDGISQLYLGGLEEVRGDLLTVKLACSDRLEELEKQLEDITRIHQENASLMPVSAFSDNSLREIIMDELESRVSQLESKLERNIDTEQQTETSLAIIDKDCSLAAAAAAEAAASAQKADEILARILQSFSTGIEDARQRSIKAQEIQESLVSNKVVADGALLDIKRIWHSLAEEKERLFSAFSEAKSKSLEMKESLERDVIQVKTWAILTDKEKEAAVSAASEASRAAVSAGKSLVELAEIQRESLLIRENIAETAVLAQDVYSRELEKEMSCCRSSIEAEIARARLIVNELEEEKRKDSIFLHEEVDSRVKKAEEAMVEMQHLVKALGESMEIQAKQGHMDDSKMREEMSEMRHNMGGISSRLNAAEERAEENLRRNMTNLENRVTENTVNQSGVQQKVEELCNRVCEIEGMQVNLNHSVEIVQSSTENLEKSAAVWLPQYETAARMLQEFEARIQALESSANEEEDDPQKLELVELRQAESLEKERLLRLYQEMSRCLQKMQSAEGREKTSGHSGQSSGQSMESLLDARLSSAEARLEHVETTTSSNLRSMDGKMERFGMKLDLAMESASIAENKCSVLGAELVKVFRLLATSRKSGPGGGNNNNNNGSSSSSNSPLKTTTTTTTTIGNEEGAHNNNNNNHHSHSHNHNHNHNQVNSNNSYTRRQIYGSGGGFRVNSKSSSSSTATATSISHLHSKKYSHSASPERTRTAISNTMTPCKTDAAASTTTTADFKANKDSSNNNINLEAAPVWGIKLNKIVNKHQEEKEKEEKKGRISMALLPEAKLPITLDESVLRRREQSGIQTTNIRLEAGRIHVNVHHRRSASSAAFLNSSNNNKANEY